MRRVARVVRGFTIARRSLGSGSGLDRSSLGSGRRSESADAKHDSTSTSAFCYRTRSAVTSGNSPASSRATSSQNGIVWTMPFDLVAIVR